MGPKQTINTFIEGMNKDMDKSLVSNKSYLDALNFRIITTEGGTSGSLENSKGNKQLSKLLDENDTLVVGSTYYVHTEPVTHDGVQSAGDEFVATSTGFTGAGYVIEKVKEDQVIIGAVEMRDEIILFTTNNAISAPTGGRSCIYKMTIDLANEEMDEGSLELLYDDNLNSGTGSTDFLLFSSVYPITAVARYETESVQKVYWTDGYNVLRVIDTSKNQTENGEVYAVANKYMTTDKFSMQPSVSFYKPVLSQITTGTLTNGMVQYAYQLYRQNGSETTFSPLSDLIHITESNDYSTNDFSYEGGEDYATNTGKGCRILISNTDNKGFDRARVVRVYYPTLNATPEIDIVDEIAIPADGSNFYSLDTGDSLGTYTAAQVGVTSTSLFSCEDIDTKDNRLFAANIEDKNFSVGDYDSRAVRYRNYTPGASGTSNTGATLLTHGTNCTMARYDDDSITITVTDVATVFGLTGETITAINTIAVDEMFGAYDATGEEFPVDYGDTDITATLISGTNSIVFRADAVGNLFTNYLSMYEGHATSVVINYDWTSVAAAIIDARVQDEKEGEKIITVPVTPGSLASWDTAGWDEYDLDHDGINQFNDPDNDFDESTEYQYQSDGALIGAEGPNITVGVTTENFIIDDSSSSDTTFYSLASGTTSYTSYASPFKTGSKSFQRGETYRFWAVFYDTEGRATFPQWICDFKMPSIRDTNYNHSWYNSSNIYGKALYPTFNFRNFPTNAVSAQVFSTPRGSNDRSVYSQGYGQLVTVTNPQPLVTTSITGATPSAIKFMSPEISFNRDLRTSSGDYIEHLGNYANVNDTDTNYGIYKATTFTAATSGANNLGNIQDSKLLGIGNDSVVQAFGAFTTFINYNAAAIYSYGGTGLAIDHDNTSWTGNDSLLNLVNYRKNVFSSQYGGNRYEDRTSNYCSACSDIITSTGSASTAKGGDTFINIFEVAVFLFDQTKATGNSEHVVVYIPVESTINCSLDHGDTANRGRFDHWYCRQEAASDSDGYDYDAGSTPYIQDKAMYQYNTVYSQTPTLDYKYAKPFDWTENDTFDTKIKASSVKVNGELADSWTTFPVNDEIEVDSKYGPINAIKTFNNNLYYFQDSGIGVASVNPRSLIQDNNSSSLVLGTGAVLDRYDYLAQSVGSQDKFSIIASKAGLYWYDALSKSIYTLSSNINNLSKAKYINSYLTNNVDTTHTVRGVYDRINDEVLMTFTGATAPLSFTIGYNEVIGAFTSFHSFLPKVYIPYKSKFLSTTSSTFSAVTGSDGYLWLHDSDDAGRCQYYSLDTSDSTEYYDSTIKILFNPDYNYTKVFDNLDFIGNIFTSGTLEVYNKMLDEIRCYNDYQNSDIWNLTYNGTYSGTTKILPYQRRERGWTTFVPRNAVDTAITSNPDIFNTGNLDTTKTFKERLRDKSMTTDLTFENDGTYSKFVLSNVGLTYRISSR